MSATVTTLTTAIKTYVDRVVPTLDSTATPLMNLIPVKTPAPGSDSVDWVALTTGNASTVAYVEGDAPVAPGNNVYSALTLANTSFYLRTMCNVSGRAIDIFRNGGNFSAISAELDNGLAMHQHAREDLTVTTIEAAIDDSGNYAGVARSTSGMVSTEDAFTPTLAEMITFWTTLASHPIDAPVYSMDFICNEASLDAWLNVSSRIQYSEFPAVVNGVVDPGMLIKMPQYNGRPIRTVGTMSAGVWLFNDWQNNSARYVFRPITIEEYAKVDDSITYAITSSEVPVVYNPKLAGKLT